MLRVSYTHAALPQHPLYGLLTRQNDGPHMGLQGIRALGKLQAMGSAYTLTEPALDNSRRTGMVATAGAEA